MEAMREKVLIFIPYQDTDNFYSDGIMTREYAMLYMLWNEGYKNVINIKKPRTLLDKKNYIIHNEYYPEGTIECQIKKILDKSPTIQYLPLFSVIQVLKRRCWWSCGYSKTIKKMKLDSNKDYLVYSDNPFASELISYLSKKKCKIYFDVMDNFAIHPSLNKDEHRVALDGYKQILKFADFISANSQQTCEFMQKYTDKPFLLVKNGVFAHNEAKDSVSLQEVKNIRAKKKGYRLCVGYIGKLGLRLDADLIDVVSKACTDILFVFVGNYLKGQINDKLIKLFESRNNVLHINGVPSAFVYPLLNEFDVLSIPHSVGKSENGGDPLKLYQYLTRNKPIITTPILGVDEYQDDLIIITEADDWVATLKTINEFSKHYQIKGIYWQERIAPIMNCITKNLTN